MSLEVPVSVLGGTIPADLSLNAGALTAGTTITLDSVSQQVDLALLRVSVSRADTGASINQLATINVMSGGQVVAALSIPVIGAASSD